MVLEYGATAPQIVESNRFSEQCRGQGVLAERPYARLERVLS